MNYKIINGSISYGAETILEEINLEIKEITLSQIIDARWLRRRYRMTFL